MNIEIAGKIVLVAGATPGIGQTLSDGLVAKGARVAVFLADRERAKSVVAEIQALPDAPEALALEADVSVEAAVTRAGADSDAVSGRVDALAGIAGSMPGPHPVLDIDLSVLKRVLRSNLSRSFLTAKDFAPLMIRGRGGRIIFWSSGRGIQANPGGAAHGGMKAAVDILANAVHQELADDGMRTVAVAPGLTVPHRGVARIRHRRSDWSDAGPSHHRRALRNGSADQTSPDSESTHAPPAHKRNPSRSERDRHTHRAGHIRPRQRSR